MKWIAYARNSGELEALKNAGASEAILCHRALSRQGGLDGAEVMRLAREARALGLRPVLEWDILMTDPKLASAIAIMKGLDLHLFDAVRVQDPAAYEYLLAHPLKPRIQLVLETGNPNFEGIRRWCDHGAGQVERVVLSVQIPKNTLAQHIDKLGMPVEVLGLGPVLLLYTPRHLLSNQKRDFSWLHNESEIARHFVEATASSEESFHSGFRVIENPHGTFVYHPKDYCLVDQLSELDRIGLAAFRVDFRLEDQSAIERYTSLNALFEAQAARDESLAPRAQAFIDSYSRKVTRCFFQANATDVLFKKLKNTRIQRQDHGYLGEVVEISRNNHLIIHVLGKNASLRLGQTVRFVNPEGAVYEQPVERLQDLEGRDIQAVGTGEFAVTPYFKLVTPRSAVYQI